MEGFKPTPIPLTGGASHSSLPLNDLIANLSCRVVPENVQKKQARDAKLLKELKERRDRERKERAEKRKTLRANAEKYYKEYQNQQ